MNKAVKGGWDHNKIPLHAGEISMQERVGVRDFVAPMAKNMMRPFMPEQHRAFFAQLHHVTVGSIDGDGWPWASVLAGPPGFIQTPDQCTMRIEARIAEGDPLKGALLEGASLGVLGLELTTRRRNRMNGTLSAIDAAGFELTVDLSFGNCPQYIQTRTADFIRDPSQPGEMATVEEFQIFDKATKDQIEKADTFFVASYAKVEDADVFEGADVSHRGGKPGFLKVDDQTIFVPEYAGNRIYNTLGNFLVTPKAGLTFVDFETGDVLMVTGTVELIFEDDPRISVFRGAERGWIFTLDHGLSLTDALPLRWTFNDYSVNTLMTGDWKEAEGRLAADDLRRQWRDYKVVKVEDESSVIRSFFLEPTDGAGLHQFKAGQFLTLKAQPEGAERAIIHTYTISSGPEDEYYRVSVKREPDGNVSKHLYDTIKVGDLITARAPRGEFFIEADKSKGAAVLIAGGVGVTPMVSMARHVLSEGLRTRQIRPLTILHASQDTKQRAFFEELKSLQQASRGTIRYLSFVDRAEDGEELGRDFSAEGYISEAAIEEILPMGDCEFFLCGPAPFMQAIYDTLRGLGIKDEHIAAEAFGPASLKRRIDDV